MKYLVTKLEINKVSGTQDDYVRLELLNEDDPFEIGQPTVCIFEDRLVNVYKTFYEEAGGDLSKLPERFRYFTGVFYVKVDLPKPMLRVYGRDFVDRNGVQHMADDFICDKSGTPRLYTSVTVMCKKSRDVETGELNWTRGWEPETRAAQYINSFFRYPSATTGESVQGPNVHVVPPAEVPTPPRAQAATLEMARAQVAADAAEAARQPQFPY